MAFLLIPAMLVACGGEEAVEETTDEPATDTATVAEEEVVEEVVAVLTADQKACNLYKNFTVVFAGSLVLAMGNTFGSMGEGFAAAAEGEEGVAALDEQIAGLEGEIIGKIDEMAAGIDEAYSTMQNEYPSVYDKMFGGGMMDEGVAIAENAVLPNGFVPLTENMTTAELKRYILFCSDQSTDENHPVMVMYRDLFEWSNTMQATFDADPEIAEFMASLNNR